MIQLNKKQLTAVAKILKIPRLLFIGQLGFGKTLVTLIACRCLLRQSPKATIAIVSRRSYLTLTWLIEQNITGLFTSDQKSQFTFISCDDRSKTVFNDSYTLVVLDECTLIKNPRSQRFNRIKSLCDKSERCLFLTAMPITKHLYDSWALAEALLNKDNPLCKSEGRLLQRFNSFLNEFFDVKMCYLKHGPVKKYFPKETTSKDITELLKPFTLALKSDNKISPLITKRIFIAPTSEFNSFYRSILDKETITGLKPADAALQCSRLHQLTSGSIYLDDGVPRGTQTIGQNSIKIDWIKERLSYSEDSIAITYSYKHQLSSLLEAFPLSETLTEYSLKRWNDKKLKILLLHTTADSHSFNLQRGGHTLIWFHLPWSPTDYYQMIGRFHRRGQSLPVINYVLLIKGTIDELIYSRLTYEIEVSSNFNSLLLEASLQ